MHAVQDVGILVSILYAFVRTMSDANEITDYRQKLILITRQLSIYDQNICT